MTGATALSFVLSVLAALSYVHHGWNPGVFLFTFWAFVAFAVAFAQWIEAE